MSIDIEDRPKEWQYRIYLVEKIDDKKGQWYTGRLAAKPLDENRENACVYFDIRDVHTVAANLASEGFFPFIAITIE